MSKNIMLSSRAHRHLKKMEENLDITDLPYFLLSRYSNVKTDSLVSALWESNDRGKRFRQFLEEGGFKPEEGITLSQDAMVKLEIFKLRLSSRLCLSNVSEGALITAMIEDYYVIFSFGHEERMKQKVEEEKKKEEEERKFRVLREKLLKEILRKKRLANMPPEQLEAQVEATLS